MWPAPQCPTRFSAAPGLPAEYPPRDDRRDPSAEYSDSAGSGRATGGGPVVAVAVRAEPQSTESPCATRPPHVGPDADPGLPERSAAGPSRVAAPAGHRCNVGTTPVGCPARSTAQRTGNTPESRSQPIATPSVIPACRRPPQPAGGRKWHTVPNEPGFASSNIRAIHNIHRTIHTPPYRQLATEQGLSGSIGLGSVDNPAAVLIPINRLGTSPRIVLAR
jgi:hypothetical protein